MTIGEKIFVELKKQGKSQKSLAKYVGISDSAIGNWKQSSDIKFENAVKASEFLGISLNYLAYGKEPTIPTEYKKLISFVPHFKGETIDVLSFIILDPN